MPIPVQKRPKPNQVCVVTWNQNGSEHTAYAVWPTDYSIYGAGGHFALPGGGQLGLPCDISKWRGTHWIAEEKEGIACAGQEPDSDAPTAQ